MVKPLITVLMTVYNNARYIREAVQSILNQTFEDFEFLIIDDGSGDNSVEIVRSFKDPRIRLLVNENNIGQTASLNLGLESAKGKYIARIDADDTAKPERLERQVAFVKKCGANFGVLGTQTEFVDENGKLLYKVALPTDKLDILWHLLFVSPVAHPSVLMDKEAVLSVGGYNVAYRYVQDQILWIHLIAAGKSVLNLEGDPLAQVRIHSKSATVKGRGRRREESVQALQEALKFLLDRKITDEDAGVLYGFLSGSLIGGKKAEIIAMRWMKQLRLVFGRYGDVSFFWGKTLLRSALLGKGFRLKCRMECFYSAVIRNWKVLFCLKFWFNCFYGIRCGRHIERLRFAASRRSLT